MFAQDIGTWNVASGSELIFLFTSNQHVLPLLKSYKMRCKNVACSLGSMKVNYVIVSVLTL